MPFLKWQVSQEEIEKYTKAALPTKESLDAQMDEFSFMPRISFAETDSIRVSVTCGEVKLFFMVVLP